MTEEMKNRVLSRTHARVLTQSELDAVNGGDKTQTYAPCTWDGKHTDGENCH